MVARKKQETLHPTILEAVETLEGIADLDFEHEIDVASKEEIAKQNLLVTAKTIKWLDREDPDSIVKYLTETFHVVHDYLRDFYKNEGALSRKPRIVEGVKTIMVLVGEAANKLDRYTTLFKKTKGETVRSLKEYRQLQEFYLTRIAKKVDQRVLGRWILELTKGVMAQREEAESRFKERPVMSTKYLFIDMDTVKKDIEYELFFIRKEDGSRFYNPRLIRNMTLICDFGIKEKEEKEEDPFHRIKFWRDHAVHLISRNIIQSLGGALDRFFQEAKQATKRELVGDINKALMALFLSSHSKNLLRNSPAKSCSEYFSDFLFFLRMALKSREYQRLIVYRPKKSARLAQCLIDIVNGLCHGLFASGTGYYELLPPFERVIHQAREIRLEEELGSDTLTDKLTSDYAKLKKLIRLHPNGPLFKDLEILQYRIHHAFDPLFQDNIPFQVYSLFFDENRSTNLHLASPTYQEFINESSIIEEFKGFLRDCSKDQLHRKHLLFNLQDKTLWTEHARSVAMEDLAKTREFNRVLDVITLPKDTDFYHQNAPYDQDHQVEVFVEKLKEHLEEEGFGFYFPKAIKQKLFPGFVNELIENIHQEFFGGMNVLTVKNRLDFIEVFYFFLQLKIIDLVKPDTFSFTCKDGGDVGGVANAQLYAMLNMISQPKIKENDVEYLDFILQIVPLLHRERLVLPERFQRMIGALRRIESTKNELGIKSFKSMLQKKFSPLYNSGILDGTIAIPRK